MVHQRALISWLDVVQVENVENVSQNGPTTFKINESRRHGDADPCGRRNRHM